MKHTKNTRIVYKCLLVLLVLLTDNVFGAQSILTRYISGSAIVNTASVSVMDQIPPYLHTITNYGYKVGLVYGRENRTDKVNATSWNYTVGYTLYYYTVNGGSAGSSTGSLTIKFDPANPDLNVYDDHFFYLGNSYPLVKLVVTSVSVPISESDIRIELTQYNNSVAQLSPSLIASPVYNSGSNTLYWKYLKGAESYDLEWTFVDKYYVNGASNVNTITAQQAFELKEPVRINVSDQYYNQFNFTYPEGKVFFRVRGVGTFVETSSTTALNGYWNYATPLDIVASNTDVAQLKSRTWQYTTSFSEEGKFKKVITYYDGTNRNRQSLTNLSSEKVVIAAEPEYDYEGRAVVAGLPVPVTGGTSLGYRPNLNSFTNGKADYAVDASKKDDPAQMTLTSASSQYYSSLSVESAPFKYWLPRADRYAYTHTQYLQDGTGRPSMSALPGAEYMLKEKTQDNEVHYTRYYYSGVGSMELSRLFGHDVGDSKYYRKTIVVDANNQASVSYSDKNGNTVATALLGLTPGNVNELSDSSYNTVTNDLMGGNIISESKETSISTYTFTNLSASPPTEYTIKYNLTGAILESDYLASCAACRYDLEIIVKDPEGNDVDGTPIKHKNIDPGAITCPQTSFTKNNLVDETLEFDMVGNYTIIKKLKINDTAVSNLVSSMVGTITLEEITEEYMNKIDYSVCENNGVIPPDLLDKLANAECESIEGQIRQQVGPGGKYYEQVGWLDAAWADNSIWAGARPSLIDLKDPDKYLQAWENALIQKHPERCHYYMCDKLKSVKKFEKEMAMVSTWSVAQDKGWVAAFSGLSPLTPNSLVSSVFPCFSSTNKDPFFLTTMTNFPATSGDAFDDLYDFELRLEELYKEGGSGDYNNNGNLNETFDIYDAALTGCTFDAAKAVTADEAWKSFKSAYLTERNKLLKKAIVNGWIVGYGSCAYSADPDAIVRPPALDLTAAQAQETIEQEGGTMQPSCSQMCEYNVSVWIQQLEINCSSLSLTEAEEDALRTHLGNICLNRCGDANPQALLLTEYYRDQDYLDANVILATDGCSLESIAYNNPYEYSYRQGLSVNAWNINDNSACVPAVAEFWLRTDSKSHTGDFVGMENDLTLSGTYPGLGYNNLIDLKGYIYAPVTGNYQFDISTNSLIYFKIDNTVYQSDVGANNDFLTTCGGHVTPSVAPVISLAQGYHSITFSRVQGELPAANYCNVLWKKPGDGVYSDIPAANLYTVIPAASDVPDIALGFMDCPYDLNQHNDCVDPPPFYTSSCLNQVLDAFNVMLELDRTNTAVPVCPGPASVWQQNTFYANPGNPEIIQCFIDVNPDCMIDNQRELFISNETWMPNKNFALLRKDQNYLGDQCPWPSDRFSNYNLTDIVFVTDIRDPNIFRIPYENIVSIGEVFMDCNMALADPNTSSKTGYHGVKAKLQVLNYNGFSGSIDAHLIETIYPYSQASIKFKYAVLPPNVFCNKTFTLTPEEVVDECNELLETIAESEAYRKYIDSLNAEKNEFLEEYYSKCMSSILKESLTGTYDTREHHYTLYYYDQSGNLIQTVPPEGVKPLVNSVANFTDGKLNASASNPVHKLKTEYKYNSLGQLVWQKTPDAGESNFIYDSKGRIRLSQNAQQAFESTVSAQKYSYTRYDKQGRIVEVGQHNNHPEAVTWFTLPANKKSALALLDNLSFPDPNSTSPLVTLTQITQTVYDNAESGMLNTRGRVAAAITKSDETTEQTRTSYSYDVHGNVNLLKQTISGLGSKTMYYVYDLISGNVKKVYYQRNSSDMLVHRYTYDSDNRIKAVFTSTDDRTWEEDAHYFYYKHGPVARVELGHDKVQAKDYYYTLQGWIKGVNMPGLRTDAGLYKRNQFDPGNDGISGVNQFVGQDEYGYRLGYYQGDYSPVSGDQGLIVYQANMYTNEHIKGKGLYNGNISSMVTGIYNLGYKAPGSMNANEQELFGLRANAYQYDQLNRLTHSYSYDFVGDTVQGSAWSRTSNTINTARYDAKYTYDANGNIKTARVNGATTGLIDDLNYWYSTGVDGKLTTNNRLDVLQDYAGSSTAVGDIGTREYSYDKIGNLTLDDEGTNAKSIQWTVYGKVALVDFYIPQGDLDKIRFTYDAFGQRVKKEQLDTSGAVISTDYYIKDASGNTTVVQKAGAELEYSLFGSEQLGTYTVSIANAALDQRKPNAKSYSLSNHLGNVLAVVSGQKLGVDVATPGNPLDNKADFYLASLKSASDYYPFGWSMPGRKFNDYRYGFNGQEKDGEFNSGSYDFGARIYDSRLGRWLAVDPLSTKYPYLSPYVGFGNKPTIYIDKDGRDTWFYTVDGVFLGRISDNLDNAITIIDQRALQFFMNGAQGRITLSKNPQSNLVEPNQDAALVSMARSSGMTYLVDPLLDLFDRSVSSQPAREHGNQLVKNNNGDITVASIPDNIGDDSGREGDVNLHGNGPNGQYTSEQQELLSKVVAHVHTHPLSENTPSPNDVITTAGNTQPGYMNAVVNQKTIVLYYGSGSQMGSDRTGTERDYGNYHSAMFINCTSNFIGEQVCVKANYNILFNKSNVGPKRNKNGNSKSQQPKPSFERSGTK